MGMKALQSFTLLIGAALLWACSASGQPTLWLEHDSFWHLGEKRNCTIRISSLQNLGAEETGLLFASIYAKPGSGFDGTGSPGTLIARAPLGSIPGNSSINNVVLTTKAKRARPGEKFTALLIETQNGRKFELAQYVIYTSTYMFPAGQRGGVGSDDFSIGNEYLGFLGTTTLGGAKRRAEFSVEKIQNQRESATTGPLRLAVYATPEPYNGTSDPVIVATRALGMLAQGDFYTGLQGKLRLKRPGRGAFYLSLVLEEDQGSGFVPVSYVNAPEPRQF
jgi:hypothetical protein